MNRKYIIIILIAFTSIVNAQNVINKESHSLMLTHSFSQNIDVNTSVVCNTASSSVYENSFYRAFDLYNTFNIYGDWVVTNIDLAIAIAQAGQNSSQEIFINLYSMSQYNSQIVLDSLTLLGSQSVMIADNQSNSVISVELLNPVTIPDGKTLVVEILIPDGTEDSNVLFLGSNNLGQSDYTYICALDCGVEFPTNISDVGYPDMMLILNIYGVYASPDPKIISFNIDQQIEETFILNEPEYTIDIIMPLYSELTELAPDIFIPAGYEITPASGDIIDFSQGSVIYSVTNDYSKITQEWDVKVINAPPYILDFVVSHQVDTSIILAEPFYTIELFLEQGADLADVWPEIEIYDGYEIFPASGDSVSFADGPVIYTVFNTELDISQEWTVSASEHSSIRDLYENKLKIYPIPAKNGITIDLHGSKTIYIYDISGKQLLNIYSNTTLEYIDLTNFNQGIYIVKVISSEGIFTRKIILTNL